MQGLKEEGENMKHGSADKQKIEALEALKYKSLQALAKTRSIRANLPKSQLVKLLAEQEV